jgi:hypothetical protein
LEPVSVPVVSVPPDSAGAAVDGSLVDEESGATGIVVAEPLLGLAPLVFPLPLPPPPGMAEPY